MDDGEGWAGDFAKLRMCLRRAAEASHHLAQRMGTQLGPEAFPSDVLTLIEDIAKARSLGEQLSLRLHEQPIGKLVRGMQMSPEEFYLLVALGVLGGGSYTGDPYTDFQMLRFEDNERSSYMTLAPKPPPGKFVVHMGLWPEEVSWQQLRPEQREFFDRHMPEFAARFRRDT